MHIKRMHEMIEKLTECALSELNKGSESVNTEEFGQVVDMIKDISEAEYRSRISKAMEEADKEEEEDIKRLMKKMKEEGEDWDEDEARRFYRGQPRSQTSGRFMSRGDGRRSNRGGRRGYEEMMMPMDYRMDIEDYKMYPPEYWRDIDRNAGRMYYTSNGQPSGGNSGGQGGQSNGASTSGTSGNMGGNSTRGYSDGYSDGYREGERNGKNSQSRYEKAKRGYEEVKQAHRGNAPEDKQLTMKETEKMLNVVFDEIDEMLEDASPEVKSLVKTKGMARFQKIQ